MVTTGDFHVGALVEAGADSGGHLSIDFSQVQSRLD